MKKYIILINFFIVFLGQLLAGQYKWDRIEIPYNIAEPGIVAYQNNIYLVGGRNGMSHYAPCSDQIWKYDPQSSNWQEMNGKLPYGMYTRNKCIVSGNKLIVSPSEGPNLQGGYGSHQKIVEYDFTSDIAVETAAYQNIVWYVTFGSFNINGNNRVYSFGGWSSNPLNEIYSYVVDSGTLQLVTTAALCERRGILLIGYDLNGKAYLFGGNSAPHNSVEVFDPVTETISNLGNILPEGLSGEGSFAWTSSTGKIFIARLDPSGKIYIFDPCDNSFTEASFGLPTPTAGFAIDYGTYNSATGSIYVIESKIWDGTDQFDSHIWIGTPATLLLPNGGEEFVSGNTEIITWQALDSIENVSIEFSDSNGLSWTAIEPNTPNDGDYEWVVPQITSDKCLVRISSVSDPNIYDTSDEVFTIFACQLDSIADLNKDCKVDLSDLAIIAMNWLRNGNPLDEGFTETLPIIWVPVDDPGVSGHEGFTGYMSKYETTNAQYCQFLNSALASGDITVDANDVIGANGSNSGEDFAGEVYYDLAGPGSTYHGATNGGATRIHYSGSLFTVDSGFENHPVTYVSWYGATAFCNYYSYRLPTEWEWQAVADYDGSYTYGCGTSINNSIANYIGSTHPDGTTVVGAFGTYGYGMCDMAGNVWEWTSTVSNSDRVIRGGSWPNDGSLCTVSYKRNDIPSQTHISMGFRVCRDMPDMKWVPINDPGVSGHEGFTGYMSKYETTNAQYCQFLNAALASEDIIVDANDVKGANGSNSGADFVGQVYYRLDGAGYTNNGATNGGATRIHYSGSLFTVDSGFENHPVTFVTWYGAIAFCNYYGYRLPTEWEWQAVADYDGSYTYGCGTDINNSIANYYGSTHPDGTTVVGAFGTYGHGMCDMAGNVWEWTSSIYNGSYHVARGGSWLHPDYECTVSSWGGAGPNEVPCNVHGGFRVCR